MMSAIETKNIRKYWLSTNAVQKITKNMKKNGEIAVIYSVFARWEAETTANTMVFEGQVAKNTVIYSFFNQRQKTLVFTMFSFTS